MQLGVVGPSAGGLLSRSIAAEKPGSRSDGRAGSSAGVDRRESSGSGPAKFNSRSSWSCLGFTVDNVSPAGPWKLDLVYVATTLPITYTLCVCVCSRRSQAREKEEGGRD